jgi:antagonist of KipI
MLEIIKPGLFTTIQDLGRWGYQSYGVCISGALDQFALTAANLLVGNPQMAAGLEITVFGPTVKFHKETLFAVAGADLGPKLDGKEIENWTCHRAAAASQLIFTRRINGVRAYLAVYGGIDVPPVMGSRSTYVLGGFGGKEGRPVKANDLLPYPGLPAEAHKQIGAHLSENLRPAYGRNPTLRIVMGPFTEYFSENGVETLLSGDYTIAQNSDRMGYRLEGAAIERKNTGELISCGLANGTMQVPANGQPIILLADRQTIGGYPIIATVVGADLPLVAQCASGDKLRFRAVSADEAQEAYRKLWANLASIGQSRPAGQP